MEPRRRTLLWALVLAAGIGFAAGWVARVIWEPTPESRARDAYEDMRDRVRELVRERD